MKVILGGNSDRVIEYIKSMAPDPAYRTNFDIIVRIYDTDKFCCVGEISSDCVYDRNYRMMRSLIKWERKYNIKVDHIDYENENYTEYHYSNISKDAKKAMKLIRDHFNWSFIVYTHS